MGIRFSTLVLCSLHVLMPACYEDVVYIDSLELACYEYARDVESLEVSDRDVERANRSFDVVVADVESIEYLSCPYTTIEDTCTSSRLHIRRSLRGLRYQAGTSLLTPGGVVDSESGIAVFISDSAVPNEGDLAVIFLNQVEVGIFYVVDGDGGYLIDGARGIRSSCLTAYTFLDQLAEALSSLTI